MYRADLTFHQLDALSIKAINSSMMSDHYLADQADDTIHEQQSMQPDFPKLGYEPQ